MTMKKKKKESRSKDLFKDFCQLWLRYRKEAIESDDYSFYKVFVEEIYKDYVKLYAEVKMPEAVSLVETVLKIATCELQVISIKCNKPNEKGKKGL